MDLGGDSFESVNVSKNDETLEGTSSFDGTKLEYNGSCADLIPDSRLADNINCNNTLPVNENGETLEGIRSFGEIPIQEPLEVAESSSSVSGETSPARKGYGLKKWRRRRREFTKDEGNGFDSNRILKRGPPNPPEAMKPRSHFVEIKQRSEGSAASAESVGKSPDLHDGFAIKELSVDSTLAVEIGGSNFAVGTDSENSGDRSSKSSTAASGPKLRHDAHIASGSAKEKHRVKNQSGSNSSNVGQKVQQVKGRIETGKKFRGENVKIEMENSHSSVGSDQKGSVYGSSNGRQREIYSSYDEANSERVEASNPQICRDDGTDYFEGNEGGNEDGFLGNEDDSENGVSVGGSLEEKGEESGSHQTHGDWDPLLKSIISLQAVQEALEIEIQNFRELGEEPILQPEAHIPSQSLAMDFDSTNLDETDKSCSHPLKAQVTDLNQKVNHLESKLKEVSSTLKLKESRIAELEDIISRRKLKYEESGTNLPFLQDKFREMEAQLEDVLQKKIKAEVEYLLISGTTQNLKVASEDRNAVTKEQKSTSAQQSQMFQNFSQRKIKTNVLRSHIEELDASSEETLDSDEVMKMKNRCCKYTLCFSVQFLLLLLWVLMFLQQLFPQPDGMVPT